MNDTSPRFRCTVGWLATFLGLTATLTAHANPDFGTALQKTQPSNGLTADYKRGSKVTLTEPVVLTGLSAALDGRGGPQSGFQQVSMSLYQDANGVPGVKVAESVTASIYAGSADRWYRFATRATPLPAGDYWIVIDSAGTADGSTPGIARDYYDTTQPANWYGNADTFVDGMSSPFGTGTAGTGVLAVRASYLPLSQLETAGRGSIAATPSKGLSADFKRGSRFTIDDGGRLYALSAYLDGKGGAAGTQKLRLALYRDAGGVPGARVSVSDEISVSAGRAASWITAEATPVTLDPGSYWVMIHSGGTAGVARDYGDGTANWYGNADNYADGASSPFGTGSAGSGTLSAAAIYFPGTVTMFTYGNTSPGSVVSKGLSADFMRGGRGEGAYYLPTPALVTAFWAYLDGNGGASGTQQLRVAMYGDDEYKDFPGDFYGESQIVSIPAGLPAGWVRFPVDAPFQLASIPDYFLTLHSGGTAGVARDYGGGTGNWYGLSDKFGDGAEDFFDWYYGQKGDYAPSIYLEYAVPAR